LTICPINKGKAHRILDAETGTGTWGIDYGEFLVPFRDKFSLTTREAEEYPEPEVRSYEHRSDPNQSNIYIGNNKLNIKNVIGVDVSPIQHIL
jgi:hypothetical protein